MPVESLSPREISPIMYPCATAKDSDLYVTQFDNSVVEDAGLLKMDFLGLKTLTLIKDTVKIVKAKHDILLDPDTFPLDDEKTYELFQRGETVGVFQYESPGMQKHHAGLEAHRFCRFNCHECLVSSRTNGIYPEFYSS